MNNRENNQTEGLFYSTEEKRLFWIPRYYTNGSCSLEQLKKNLKEGEDTLRKHEPINEISCDEILYSSRYKSMWYFAVNCENCPKEAFKLGEDWTMSKWIHN